MGDLLSGNLGRSYRQRTEVTTLIVERLPLTAKLSAFSFLLALLIALPLGVLAAVHRNTWIDVGATMFAVLVASSPVFFTGILLILVFSYKLGWLPALGAGEGGLDTVKHLFLPALTLGISLAAITTRITRSSMVEALTQDYIETARAKGLPARMVILKHAFRNALIPIVTVFGLLFGFLIVGTVLVEHTFGLGGLGSLLIDAVQVRDYPVVQGATVFIAGLFILINLLVDVLYAIIDPRVRFGGKAIVVAVDVAALAIPTTQEVVHSSWSMFWWRMRHNPKAIVGGVIVVLLLVVAITAPVIAPNDPTDGELADSLAPPGQGYLLGADKNGRDILSRLIYGTRTALGGALMIVIISEVIGVPIGIWAAYRGGWVDETITRVWDMLLAFPPLLLAFAVVAAFGPGLPKAALALGILYVPFIARVVRSVTLVQKEMAYTEAARALGYGQGRIIFRHILPNCVSPIIVVSSIDFAYALLDLAALSYLGLGVQPPTPDWGTMLSEGQLVLLTSPHVALAAGLAIVVAVLGFNLLGDGLRDVLDPRQAQR